MNKLNNFFNRAGEVVKQVDKRHPNIKYTLGLLVVYLILLWAVVPDAISQFLLMCYGAWCVGQQLDEAGKWIAGKIGK